MRKAAFCTILFILAIFLAGALPAAAAPRYTWLDLKTVAGPDVSSYIYPNGIDNAGEVVGKAYPRTSAAALLNPGDAGPAPLQPTGGGESIPFPFFWGANGYFGLPPGLGPPPAPNGGWEAQGLSRGGKHTGGTWWKGATPPRTPQAWVGPGPQGGSGSGNFDLGGPGGLGGSGSGCNAVNDSGQAVGWAYNASMDSRAFLYSGGVIQDLNSLAQNLPPGVILAVAHGINNAGQVVGYTNGSRNTAFLYDGAYHDLGTLAAPYNAGSCGYAINSSGQVAGDSSGTSGGYPVYHAFLYTNGEMQDLGVLPGGLDSRAYGVNDLGQVVGYSTSATGVRAFLYSGGGMYDLNDLVLNLPAGVVLACAFGINDRGQIIAQSGGSPHAYVLTPVAPLAGVDLLLLQ